MMKFDPSSIYNRAVASLQQNPDWKPIMNQSVISAIIKANAEMNAETARYAEYLFKESKWDTAQNDSSILAMASMLQYHPKRRVSATGKIVVSADPKTALVGKTISKEVFDLVMDNQDTSSYNVNWIGNPYGSLTLTSDSVIKDSKGNQYIPTSSVTLPTNGNAVEVNVIQGIRKVARISVDTMRKVSTVSRLNPYRYIPFKLYNCEDASSLVSRKFLKLYIINNSSYEEYRVVDSLLLSDATDKDVEIYGDMYDPTLYYAKFNNSPYKGSVIDLSSNSSITAMQVEYLESLGSKGNIDTLYETFSVSGVTQGNSIFAGKLYGTNLSYIGGGTDEENIASIKENANKFYIKNYTIGTVETYEKTILNTSFTLESNNLRIAPKKVKVFGGNYTEDGIVFPVTYISFISDNLEDIAYSSSSTQIYQEIENSLNYYLARLKSPQDVLKFAIPTYVPIAIGMNCIIDSESISESTDSIESSIQNYIDSLWGTTSDYIDFGNSFYSSKLEKEIMNNFSTVKSVDMEVEALHRCDWGMAEFLDVGSMTGATNHLRTIRVPFQFSNVFLGSKSNKGFKDYRVGANYLLRMDIMYKSPKSMGGSPLHKTFFVDADGSTSSAFHVISDTKNIWIKEGDIDFDIGTSDYAQILSSQRLDNCYEINYMQKVYTDNDYRDLKSRIQANTIATQNSSSSLGAVDDYIIYFSGNYDSSSSTIGNGWVEFGLDVFHQVLTYFSQLSDDASLKSKLQSCNLAILKCGTLNDTTKLFDTFKGMLSDYIDVYISMRPIDNNLKLESRGDVENSSINLRSILYIDSSDAESANNTRNLTLDKKSRMISVNCEYEG